MKIGEVEKITGLTAKAIRLYEEKGLISVVRKDNSYRDYTESDIDKLKFIKNLRDMGVSLSQICLHFNGILTFEEIITARKREMEKENIFHSESYNKCVKVLESLQAKDIGTIKTDVVNIAYTLLGLDIGTTNISATIIDYNKHKVLETYVIANNSKIDNESDFSEFDTEWIVNKAKLIVDYLLEAYPNIKSIGITGQMHGFVYVSEAGKAVSNFYNWQDGRGNRKLSEEKTYCQEIFNKTGYICNSGYAFTTMFYNNINYLEPTDAESFCSIMDYIVMVLTDRKTPLIHISNAASFGLFDVEKNRFDKDALKGLNLTHIVLPEIASDSDIAGYYKNIPVTVAIGDNQASVFGSIHNDKTDALVNFGTGSQVSVVTDKFPKLPEELEIRPYVFGKYLICGSALCGGRAYAIIENFFAEYVRALSGDSSSQYELMNTLAEDAYINGSPLPSSTLFCGTRQNPDLRGCISQIDDKNFTPGNLILGILCGMADELKSYFDIMRQQGITRIIASGNAVKRNPVLQKVLGDTFKTPVILTTNNEEAATGCALYAGVASKQIEITYVKNIIKEMTDSEQR